MTGLLGFLLRIGRFETQRTSHVKIETESGVMHPGAKERSELLEPPEARREA